MTIPRWFAGVVVLIGFTAAVRAADDPPVLLPQYEQISAALAADDLPAARNAAQKLAASAVTLHHADMAATARRIAGANDLAGAREAFKALSAQAIALAHGAKGYFVVTCPMAQADWLQRTKEIRNPYLGREMLSCGRIKE
jgi:DNA-binding FadR family transcriptional regulator